MFKLLHHSAELVPLSCYDEMNLNIFHVPHLIIVQNHPVYDAAMQLTNGRLQSSLQCVETCIITGRGLGFVI